jgi:hypothetical protein
MLILVHHLDEFAIKIIIEIRDDLLLRLQRKILAAEVDEVAPVAHCQQAFYAAKLSIHQTIATPDGFFASDHIRVWIGKQKLSDFSFELGARVFVDMYDVMVLIVIDRQKQALELVG